MLKYVNEGKIMGRFAAILNTIVLNLHIRRGKKHKLHGKNQKDYHYLKNKSYMEN
jgi:hypothetical protein